MGQGQISTSSFVSLSLRTDHCFCEFDGARADEHFQLREFDLKHVLFEFDGFV